MELSPLPLILLLLSNIRPGQTQVLIEAPKPLLIVQPEPSQIFRGENVTLTCDIQGDGWKCNWECGDEQHYSEEKELKITVESEQKCRCYGCRDSLCSRWSDNVTLTLSERPKPRLTVQPEPSQIFRGQTVNLTCDIQQTGDWQYSWYKDDSLINVSQSQEYRISSVSESHTGQYSCTGRETRGSRYSHTSDEVTLTVSGSSVALFGALVIGVISGLSGAVLLIFLLVLLFCCKRNKAGGSTDHQPQNSSQTSDHQRNGQTPSCSNTVIGPSCVTYIKIDLKSMKEMRKKNKENKETERSDTVYSKVKF